LFAFLFTLNPLAVAHADSPAEEVASKARQVLRRHCGECHGAVNPRAGLSVLDRTSLVEQDRVVAPGKPGDSELLQLVEAGTMPPGTKAKVSAADREVLRQWIEGGAAPFPREFGEDFVLQSILKDVRQRSGDAKALAATRYFSLNHYLPDAESDLDRAREAFAKTLQFLAPSPGPVQLVPIDPNQTMFRVDLRQLGWEETPFDDATVNLYDLLLLEYPYASLPNGSDVWRALAEQYFRVARPVRPIAYMNADWLVQTVLRPPFSKELLKAQVKTPPAGLEKLAPRQPEGPSQRRLLPLDGETVLAHKVDHPFIRIDLETINYRTREVTSVFPPKAELVVQITNRGKSPIYFQLLFSSTSDGRKYLAPGMRMLEPNKPFRFPSESAEPPFIPLTEDLGKDYITVFAADEPLPEGKVLHSEKGVADRVLHNLYPIRPDEKLLDVSNWVKKTIVVETRAEKK
jgi:hypothetical protein